ncbi:hypothetical protein CKO23_03790 [Thiocystis violacea]|nr:hypothetical protein [Thiocystis violacea]
MKRLLLFIPLIALPGLAQSWAVPDFDGATLGDTPLFLYATLIWALVGVTGGVFAGRMRGFNAAVGAIGGLFLGPLSLLLFFVPARTPALEAPLSCPVCARRIAPGQALCGGCGWDPKKPSVTVEPSPVAPSRKEASAPKKQAVRSQPRLEVPQDLSSEFAQYSEMLRRSLPGALDRPVLIDYTEKFAQVVEDDAIRCSNPRCKRLLPPPYHLCPHCGTEQAETQVRAAGHLA